MPKFKQATEPTNIIWENRYIKGVNLWARLFGALVISIFMLTIVFWVIFFFKQAQIKNQKQWPDANCNDMMSQYNSTEILNYAGMEWLELKKSSGTALMSGALKCQCVKDIKAYGPFPTGLYKAYDDTYTFTDGDGVVHSDVVMCKEYI